MNNTTDSTQTHLIKSSIFGVLRGFGVGAFTSPIENVKFHYQCSTNSDNIARVVLGIFNDRGLAAFWEGFKYKLLKTSLKQFWCWPMITGVPIFLQRYHLGDLSIQAITGLSIAAIDATVTTPLERIRILSAYKGKVSFSLRDAYKQGWQGFSTHFANLSVHWITFLTAQKYLRDKNATESHPLSMLQLTKIGTQVGIIVSLVSAPFDFANTLKQAKNVNPSQLFSNYGIFKLYRGWPLSTLSLVIHNIASVIIIDKLSRP